MLCVKFAAQAQKHVVVMRVLLSFSLPLDICRSTVASMTEDRAVNFSRALTSYATTEVLPTLSSYDGARLGGGANPLSDDCGGGVNHLCDDCGDGANPSLA